MNSCSSCAILQAALETERASHASEVAGLKHEVNYNNVEARMQYAGAIGLLCQASLKLKNDSESEDIRDCIERAVRDWCKLTGWTYKRILHRIEVFPPIG